jgi:glutamate carboxypeptidase
MIPVPIANLRTQADALRDQLIAWANVNSGSGNPAGLAQMRAVLADAFAGLAGVQVTSLALADTEAQALRVRCRPEAPSQVLLSGHYDTVYGPEHAFQRCALLDAHMLRGPGVADMKGGLVVMRAALTAFEQTRAASRLGWEALITPDEETGSVASAPLIAETARRHRLALVFEPARGNGDLVQSRKGTGNFAITCHGRAAHAARVPNDGRNAIVALAGILPALHRIPDEIPGVLLNIGRIAGGGALNVVPDLASAELNMRVARVVDGDRALARIRALLESVGAQEGFRAELRGGFDRPPKECGPVEQVVFAEWQRIGQELGVKPFSWVHAGGGSDGNLLSAAGLPNLDGVGPVGDHLHSEREYCELPTLVERAQIAALFLHRLASGEFELPGT